MNILLEPLDLMNMLEALEAFTLLKMALAFDFTKLWCNL